MDKETCLQRGVSLCLLSYRMAPLRFPLACQPAQLTLYLLAQALHW